MVAHGLEKEALLQPTDHIWSDYVPQFIYDHVIHECDVSDES